MRTFRSQLFIQCDCCGKSKMYENQDQPDDRYMWTYIHINARIDKDHYLDHSITVCPDCCNVALTAIKEKCNYFNNWPVPYNINIVGNVEGEK